MSMPGPGFQKGNKVGNRFKKGVASNPLGNQGGRAGGGIPRTIKARWMSVESGLKNAGLVLDIVNQELDNPEVQEGIRQSVRRLANSDDPATTLRFLTFVMTFAPKVKQEALTAEFTGNSAALARAVAKLNTPTCSDPVPLPVENNQEIVHDNAQVVDIGL